METPAVPRAKPRKLVQPALYAFLTCMQLCASVSIFWWAINLQHHKQQPTGPRDSVTPIINQSWRPGNCEHLENPRSALFVLLTQLSAALMSRQPAINSSFIPIYLQCSRPACHELVWELPRGWLGVYPPLNVFNPLVALVYLSWGQM